LITLVTASLAASAWWVWTGHEGSLATSLSAARLLLPSSQTLTTTRVQGSLRHGGLVGQLHWHDQGLDVQATDTRLQLHWPLLWQGQLPLIGLDIGQLTVQDQRPTSPKVAMTALPLPLKVQLPVHIGQLHWAGPPALDITGLQAEYAYDGQDHRLSLAPFDIAQGRYTVQARLQAAAPMALDLQLEGQVQTAGTTRTRALTLDAQATVQGTLSGPMAQLAVAAQVSPAGGAASPGC
jgi:translocation and assembly module TamB